MIQAGRRKNAKRQDESMGASIYQAERDDPVTQRMLKDQRISVIVDNFHGVNWWKKCKVFPLFTVYYDTKDFPGKYCVRLFDGQKPTPCLSCPIRWKRYARQFLPCSTVFPANRETIRKYWKLGCNAQRKER